MCCEKRIAKMLFHIAKTQKRTNFCLLYSHSKTAINLNPDVYLWLRLQNSFYDKFLLRWQKEVVRAQNTWGSLSLKLVSSFLYFTKRKHFENYEKCFSLHLESSFNAQDIHFFVIFSPYFPHCFLIQRVKLTGIIMKL